MTLLLDDTDSASAVVKPTVVNADRAWNFATETGSPVAMRAPVTIRVRTMDMSATTKNVPSAITVPLPIGPARSVRPRPRVGRLPPPHSGNVRGSGTVALIRIGTR